jgi:L-Lysine epsilon oxidase N-terminal/L-lysine epsilon oxidase C-terminal domain
MGTVYKIHPAIGVARVGNAETAYFIGPEAPGSPGVEIDEAGTETPVTAYKTDGRVKRQAARFRIFAYEEGSRGNLDVVGEVDSAAVIEWTVDLVNRKAALDRSAFPAEARNLTVTDRESLVIGGTQPSIVSGRNRPPEPIVGTFLGTEVHLGELRTDASGRLVVLGGRGTSGSVPPGQPLTHFANNDGWYDDVSDGPVRATVTLPGEKPVSAHGPAWVVVAPPDFAPEIDATVSLYDVAYQCGITKGVLHPELTPSFTRHIRPLIERTLSLRWVDSWQEWSSLLPVDWDELSDPGAAAHIARQTMAQRVKNPQLSMFALPAFISAYLDQWVAGDFLSDLETGAPAEPLPQQLDRAALEHCSGNNFFPGIEAGQNLKDENVYAEPPRLDATNLGKVYPGCLTEVMAVPWQADFYACDGGIWWPTQRPDLVMTDANAVPSSSAEWEKPIDGFRSMVDHVLQLGFIVPHQAGDETIFLEADRDPTFPRP